MPSSYNEHCLNMYVFVDDGNVYKLLCLWRSAKFTSLDWLIQDPPGISKTGSSDQKIRIKKKKTYYCTTVPYL